MILAMFASFDPRKNVSNWAWHDLWILALWGVGSVFVAARRWSWAPRSAQESRLNPRRVLNR